MSTIELFPPGKVFQSRYAAFALQNRLRNQLRTVSLLQHFVDQVVLMSEQSAMNEVLLRNTIQHLNKALLSTELINETLSSPQELQLAAVLVSVLLEFLRGKL
jgi:ubiquitin carboxyl-terminal hydrolase 34